MLPLIYTYSNNLFELTLPNVILWFYYNTLIAFKFTNQDLVINENIWNNTSENEKHLNIINRYKNIRVPEKGFKELWDLYSYSKSLFPIDSLTKLLKDIESGKKLVMRRPPISCPKCGEKITTYEWIENKECFKHECKKCGEVMYG